jgi:phosphate transport system substrate-binding protein
MNRRDFCLALAGGAGAVGCTRTGTLPQPARQALLVSGARAMLPLARGLCDAFMAQERGLAIEVEPGGSLPAYIAARRGAIDVATMTRALRDTEDDAGARQYLVARDALGIIVHPALPVPGLTRAQVCAAFAGAVANWHTLGGPDLPVTVYAQPRGTMARQVAEQVLQDGGELAVGVRECAHDAALVASVAGDPGAIACLDGRARAALLNGQVAQLDVDGMRATSATILSGRYPFTHSFYLLLHGAPGGVRSDFVRFACSTAGQAIVARHGLVPVR